MITSSLNVSHGNLIHCFQARFTNSVMRSACFICSLCCHFMAPPLHPNSPQICLKKSNTLRSKGFTKPLTLLWIKLMRCIFLCLMRFHLVVVAGGQYVVYSNPRFILIWIDQWTTWETLRAMKLFYKVNVIKIVKINLFLILIRIVHLCM